MVKAKIESLTTYIPIVTSDDTVNITLRPKWTIKYAIPYNYGNIDSVYVGYNSLYKDTSRVLIQNDSIRILIPSTATITSARLVLYTVGSKTINDTGSGKLYLYRVDSTWSEGTDSAGVDTANWIQRLKGSSKNWNVYGGDYRNVLLDSASYSNTKDSVVFYGDSLKAQVQRWIAKIDSNNGLLIRDSSETGTTKKWYIMTSDNSNRQINRVPTWDIWYTTPITLTWYPLYIWSRLASGQTGWVHQDSIPSTSVGNDTAHYIFIKGSYYSTNDSLLTKGQIDSIILATKENLRDAISDSIQVKISMTAGENITAFQLVYIPKDSSTIYRADANDTAKVRVLGMAESNINAGSSGYVKLSGIIENGGWTLVPGKYYYLSETIGENSQNLPSSTPAGIVPVGYAITTKKLYLFIGGVIFKE
jgi:hypothetical protein